MEPDDEKPGETPNNMEEETNSTELEEVEPLNETASESDVISGEFEKEEGEKAISISKEEKIQLAGKVEAALFLAGRPLGEMELAEALNSDRITVRWGLRWIKRHLEEQKSALEVLNLTKDRWVLQLCEEFSRGLYDYIEEFIPKEEMLSREEVDTLTEIAYRQPISTTLLLKITGNPNVYEHIRNLSEKGFIHLEKQEKSNVLTTTGKFADIYGFDTEMRNLKIQLVWRLKKRAKFEED
jgi:chromosome segregation and condensation protein ScpB